MTTTTRIRALTASAIVVAGALTLAACSTGSAATSAPSVAPVAVAPPPVSVAPIDTPSTEPTASEAASPEASTAEVTAVPTSIDPCKIVTVDEVNKLTGANFKAGKAETERQVALLAAQGLTSRQIAEQAFIAPKTVGNVLGRVYSKLGIHSRAELGSWMAAADRTSDDPSDHPSVPDRAGHRSG